MIGSDEWYLVRRFWFALIFQEFVAVQSGCFLELFIKFLFIVASFEERLF